jgi:hypothetical protein
MMDRRERVQQACDGTKVSLNKLQNCTFVLSKASAEISFNTMTHCTSIAKNVTKITLIAACRDGRFAPAVQQV